MSDNEQEPVEGSTEEEIPFEEDFSVECYIDSANRFLTMRNTHLAEIDVQLKEINEMSEEDAEIVSTLKKRLEKQKERLETDIIAIKELQASASNFHSDMTEDEKNDILDMFNMSTVSKFQLIRALLFNKKKILEETVPIMDNNKSDFIKQTLIDDVINKYPDYAHSVHTRFM